MHSIRSQISCIGYTHVAKPDSWYDLRFFILVMRTFELDIDLLHQNKWLIIRRWNSCSGVFWSLDWFSMSEVVHKKMRRPGRLSYLWIQQIQVSDIHGNKRWLFTTNKHRKIVFPLLASVNFFFPFQNHLPKSDHLPQRMLLYLPHCRHRCPAKTDC